MTTVGEIVNKVPTVQLVLYNCSSQMFYAGIDGMISGYEPYHILVLAVALALNIGVMNSSVNLSKGELHG